MNWRCRRCPWPVARRRAAQQRKVGSRTRHGCVWHRLRLRSVTTQFLQAPITISEENLVSDDKKGQRVVVWDACPRFPLHAFSSPFAVHTWRRVEHSHPYRRRGCAPRQPLRPSVLERPLSVRSDHSVKLLATLVLQAPIPTPRLARTVARGPVRHAPPKRRLFPPCGCQQNAALNRERARPEPEADAWRRCGPSVPWIARRPRQSTANV